MDFPASMPKELDRYRVASNEEMLFVALLNTIDDLVFFFANACDDETWTENHQALVKKLLDLLTTQTYYDRLSKNNYLLVARAIQKHFLIIAPLLPKNILIKLKDVDLSFNGLLLTAASDFFKQILIQVSLKETNTLFFPEMQGDEFAPIGEFMAMGEVTDLGTKSQDELIQLIKRASAWELPGLSMICERTLQKYLDRENIFEMLTLAKKEYWSDFEQFCIDFINSREDSLRLSVPAQDRLAFEFLDFSEHTLTACDRFRSLITDITCSGKLIEHPQFALILKKFPSLIGIDVSRSSAISQLEVIPLGLKMLNLSECAWLGKDVVKNILSNCPNLEHLILQSNMHLNYTFWGEISRWTKLKKLELDNCTQIQDSDLNLMLKGLHALTALSLSNCKKLNEKGFLDLAKGLPYLVMLGLSRTNVSDTALVEIGSRCRNLTEIDISGCHQLSEKGILAFIQNAMYLKKLNIENCNLSKEFINRVLAKFAFV